MSVILTRWLICSFMTWVGIRYATCTCIHLHLKQLRSVRTLICFSRCMCNLFQQRSEVSKLKHHFSSLWAVCTMEYLRKIKTLRDSSSTTWSLARRQEGYQSGRKRPCLIAGAGTNLSQMLLSPRDRLQRLPLKRILYIFYKGSILFSK